MSGIYIHIPFCKQACSYCDFHFSTSLAKKDTLIKAIAKELLLRKNELKEPLETIYFGGGTPSLLTITEIEFLITTIYTNFKVIKNPEITLEANPDDLSITKIKALANSSVNRLSVGIQSFFDEDLIFMRRAHNSKEAINCLNNVVQYFDNVTIDLIYGTPTLTNENWLKNIKVALDLGVKHISSYALTVEDKTILSQQIKKHIIKPLDEQKAQEQFYLLKEILEKANFTHYEVSNFAKKGYFSKHNTSYWLGKNYLGVGPSAHSFNGKQRSWNVANNSKYIKSIHQNKLPNQVEILTKTDLFNESIMIGLRTNLGISLDKITTNFSEKHHQYILKEAKKHLLKKQLIIKNNYLKATKKGLFFIDGIASDLFMVN